MLRRWLLAMGALAMLSGCDETTAPRDTQPPAAPRGLRSVTGDGEARLSWLANTESDVAGYRVYMSPCAGGPDCPYDPVGVTTGTMFVAPLTNGQTRFFAVTAYDRAGNESELSKDYVFDTPRPAGFGLALTDNVAAPATSGFDFSAEAVVPFDSYNADIFFTFDGSTYQMIAPFTDTRIQDAGYTTSLDDVDYAPPQPYGWPDNGSVKLFERHSYVLWMDNGVGGNYAKFRVVSLSASPARVVIDWAYQADPGNPELRARHARPESARERRPIAWLR